MLCHEAKHEKTLRYLKTNFSLLKKISSLLKSSEIRENLRYIFNIVT